MDDLVDRKTKGRLFVDMDGTLAEFKQISSMEMLYEKGYFRNLKPIQTVVDAIKHFMKEHPDVEVKILSAVLDSKHAETEKNQWLDQHLPEIKKADRIFTRYGEDKTSFIQGGVSSNDYLLDDYTKNLSTWKEFSGIGIKLLNGINNTNNSWDESRVRFNKDPKEIAHNLASIIKEKVLFIDDPLVRDEIIQHYSSEFSAIKYISEETAQAIEKMNQGRDKPFTVQEIRQAYKDAGKRLEQGNPSDADKQEFDSLGQIIDDFKKAQLTEKKIQAQQKSMEVQVSKTADMELA
jgi:5'(3')-deoxyribonucleotidase/DNA-binding transcriptional MerR regulator